MTNSYHVDHGLSQDAPGPLEPVEIAQQPGAAPATGNTARDQEMYAAGIRTGEENAKHNAAIRAGAGWLPIESAPKDGTPILAFWRGGPAAVVSGRSYGITMMKNGAWVNADDTGDNYSTPSYWMPLPAAPGVSTVEDERQAFEAWAKERGYQSDELARCKLGIVSPEYFNLNTENAWKAWQARARIKAPAAGDAQAWQGLTKDEQDSFVGELIGYGTDFVVPLYAVVESIEKRLREKNDACAAAQRKGDA